MEKLNDTNPNTHEAIKIVDTWREKYHTDTKGNIIFQNKETLSNIFFNNHSFNLIKNRRGLDNLPETLTNPSEIWSYWDDPKKQIVTMRNYILFGSNISYICQTKDGKVINAFGVTASLVNRYRKGLILIQ